jgi:hypothetical protein
MAVAVVMFLTPMGVKLIKSWGHDLQVAADEVDYNTKKQVEDTARSMIASYKSDVLTYEAYINSDDEEEQSWAKQAKIRANTTATSYNEYYLKNNYVWKENIPDDIYHTLETLE